MKNDLSRTKKNCYRGETPVRGVGAVPRNAIIELGLYCEIGCSILRRYAFLVFTPVNSCGYTEMYSFRFFYWMKMKDPAPATAGAAPPKKRHRVASVL